MSLLDSNVYNITVTDQASGLPIYRAHTSYVTATSCYDNTVVINNIGFHGPDVTIVKPKDTFRIIVVGSSYAEARQVSVARMYSTLLQNKLNALPDRTYTYEVVPIGFDGNKTFLNTLYYSNFARPLHPDLVIDLETSYEFINGVSLPQEDSAGNLILKATAVDDSSLSETVKVLGRYTKLTINLYGRFLLIKSNLLHILATRPFVVPLTTPNAATTTPQDNDFWNIKAKLVNTLAKEVSKDESRFVFASWFSSSTPTTDALEWTTHMHATAQRSGFVYNDLTPSMTAQEANNQMPTWPCDPHWSEAGNAYAAEALYEFLNIHPDLLKR